MQLDNRNEIIELYDIYGELLTEKQKDYFLDYYFSDLSLSEIASNHSISRNGVYDQLKRAVLVLQDYESKLKLNSKYKKIELLEQINESIKETIINILKE